MNYIVFNSIGEILRTGMCADSDFELQAQETEYVIEGTANDLIHRINMATFEVEDKPELLTTINKTSMLANGIDLIIISDIPGNTRVDIAGEVPGWTVNDGTFELTVDTVGTYKIIVTHPLYLPKEYTINAS